MTLSKISKELIDNATAENQKPVCDMTVPEYRAMLAKFINKDQNKLPNIQIQDLLLKGRNAFIPARKYKCKESGTKKVIIYLLGGGFVGGNLDDQELHCKIIADKTKATVIAVSYRLAPEYQFPIGLYDSFDAVLAVLKNKTILADSTQMSIWGYSSGGNYATTIASFLTERKIKFHSLFLISPCLDLSRSCKSHQQYKEGYLLDQKDLDWHFKHYLSEKDAKDLKNPLISPFWLKNPSFDLSHKVIIAAAECCPFYDESKEFHGKLNKQNVPVKFLNYPGELHLMFKICVDQPLQKGNPLEDLVEVWNELENKTNNDKPSIAPNKNQYKPL